MNNSFFSIGSIGDCMEQGLVLESNNKPVYTLDDQYWSVIHGGNMKSYLIQNLKIIIKITEIPILYFWSRDGIQIFSLDLGLDLFIGRNLILFLPRNSSKTVIKIPTASLVVVSLYLSPVLPV